MSKKRIHILGAVNAANVSKDGDTFTIRDVCGAADGIVMNRRMYPGDQLAAGVQTLEGKPAPAGHPKNRAGHYISATNGEALASAWIGSYCTNARHTGGRTLVDIVINGKQAAANPKGAKLIERLDAAINGSNTQPIHVSTGLNADFVQASGESMGKKYDTVVTNIRYDHLAILLDEQGAATPEQGVGMFLNSSGSAEEVEFVNLDLSPVDRRAEGLMGWVRKLLGNSSDLSFDQIDMGLRQLLPDGAWVREVFPKYFVWTDGNDGLYKQDYSVGSDNQISLTGQPVAVIRKVEYKAIEATNSKTERTDAVKEHILAALNAAGISVTGLDETQLLAAYNSLVAKPHIDALAVANTQLQAINKAKQDAEAAELEALAGKLAVNSSLTVADLKGLGLARLKEIAATAAPVLVGNKANQTGDEFAGYSLNKAMEAK